MRPLVALAAVTLFASPVFSQDLKGFDKLFDPVKTAGVYGQCGWLRGSDGSSRDPLYGFGVELMLSPLEEGHWEMELGLGYEYFCRSVK